MCISSEINKQRRRKLFATICTCLLEVIYNEASGYVIISVNLQ